MLSVPFDGEESLVPSARCLLVLMLALFVPRPSRGGVRVPRRAATRCADRRLSSSGASSCVRAPHPCASGRAGRPKKIVVVADVRLADYLRGIARRASRSSACAGLRNYSGMAEVVGRRGRLRRPGTPEIVARGTRPEVDSAAERRRRQLRDDSGGRASAAFSSPTRSGSKGRTWPSTRWRNDARRWRAHCRSLRRGAERWRVHARLSRDARRSGSIEVEGKTLLVVGLGGIGTEVAQLAHGLGMHVIATRNSRREGPDYVEYVGLADEYRTLAARADVVVNATPLTPETRGMFDARVLRAR